MPNKTAWALQVPSNSFLLGPHLLVPGIGEAICTVTQILSSRESGWGAASLLSLFLRPLYRNIRLVSEGRRLLYFFLMCRGQGTAGSEKGLVSARSAHQSVTPKLGRLTGNSEWLDLVKGSCIQQAGELEDLEKLDYHATWGSRWPSALLCVPVRLTSQVEREKNQPSSFSPLTPVKMGILEKLLQITQRLSLSCKTIELTQLTTAAAVQLLIYFSLHIECRNLNC